MAKWVILVAKLKIKEIDERAPPEMALFDSTQEI